MRTSATLTGIALFCLVLITAPIYGLPTAYNFSYTFDGTGFSQNFPPGTVLSGSVEGTQVGNVIEITSVLNIYFDGSPLPGPFSIRWYSGSGEALMSPDVTQCNFLLEDSLWGSGGGIEFFNIPLSAGFGFTYIGTGDDTDTNFISDEPAIEGNWYLTPLASTIFWNTPSPITYGTALGSGQLNATASVPGTFSYNPPSGTVLSVGTNTLSVTFTPNDTTHYNTATATVSLVVVAASATLTVSAAPADGGTVSGGGTFPAGSSETVIATANTGYTFVNWTDQNNNVVSTSADYTFTLNSDETLVANFIANTATITVNANPTAGGTVSGGGTYPVGSQQQISAAPALNYIFVSWNDGNTDNPRTITVPSGGATYTATFVLNQASIVVLSNPYIAGAVTGGGTYIVGSQQQISASSSIFDSATGSFYTFIYWDDDGSTANPRTITVPPLGATYTAVFVRPPGIIFYHEPEALFDVRTGLYGVGHAFLEMSASTGASIYYGFYPMNNAFFCGWPGKVVDDSSTPWDFAIAFPLNGVQYREAAAVITQDLVSPPIYCLNSFNCMDWVAKIATTAGITLPPYKNTGGISDPYVFWYVLQGLGAGANYDGGLVIQNDSPINLLSKTLITNRVIIPDLTNQVPYDYSYTELESAGHTNAAALAASIGLAYDPVNLGTEIANITNGITLNLVGGITNEDIISMSWGDGTAYQEQLLAFSHVYTNGTYQADLLVIDAGAVHSYSMTVTVSSSQGSSVTVNVTQFPPASIPNQGFIPVGPVPDFDAIEPTSISLLSNGEAVISFVGVSNWTYTIEAASDLTQGFLPIGSGTAGTNGVFQFIDLGATNFGVRLYRGSYP